MTCCEGACLWKAGHQAVEQGPVGVPNAKDERRPHAVECLGDDRVACRSDA